MYGSFYQSPSNDNSFLRGSIDQRTIRTLSPFKPQKDGKNRNDNIRESTSSFRSESLIGKSTAVRST